MNRPKRVAAIHDLSSFGRCALSVIIPTLSAMGIQVCPVPTAVLSTHTGGFTDMVIHPCPEFPVQADRHWLQCGVTLEAIYSGYLGDARQIHQVLECKANHPEALLVADPVLGDGGSVYSGIPPALTKNMRLLAEQADLITPNPTEAALLLGQPYSDTPCTLAEAKALLEALSFNGKTAVLLTGLPLAGEGICNLGCSKNGNAFLVPCHYLEVFYPGTGDIFTSVVTGALLEGASLAEATVRATLFTEHCIALTVGSGEPERDGVFLEAALPWLLLPNPSDQTRHAVLL